MALMIDEAMFKIGGDALGRKGVKQKRVNKITKELMQFRKETRMNVSLTTSGSVEKGKRVLGALGKDYAETPRQVLAGTGGHKIIAAWDKGLEPFGTAACQVLVTHEDISDERTGRALAQTHKSIHEAGIIPVYNQNDPIAIRDHNNELLKMDQGADNDWLAAGLAVRVGVQAVFFLTKSVDGFMKDGELESRVHADDVPSLQRYLYQSDGQGTGGMASKLEAAAHVARAGKLAFIGSVDASYIDIFHNRTGTQVVQ